MKLLCISCLLFVASFSFAQNKILRVFLLKDNGTYVNAKDSADYLRFVSSPDSGSDLYTVNEYYKDGKKKLIGKSSKIEPLIFEGQSISYYKNGTRQSVTTYKDGTPVGVKYEFYPNGRAYRAIEFPVDNGPDNEYMDEYIITANYDSLGAPLVENGNGVYKGYTEGFKEVGEEGAVKNGKRDGLWKGSSKNMKITFVETYGNGALISGTSTGEDGKIITYTKSRGTPPRFKGGLEAFYKYLGNNIQYPDDARANNVQGTVELTFIVEKDGKIADIKVKKSVSETIDTEATRVLNNSPRWIPGTLFGQNVKVVYSVPISFKLSD